MSYLFQSAWDISAVVMILLYAAIGFRLKIRHQPSWTALGNPAALYSDLDAASRGMFMFLVTGKVFALRDHLLSSACIAWYLACIGTIIAAVRHLVGIG